MTTPQDTPFRIATLNLAGKWDRWQAELAEQLHKEQIDVLVCTETRTKPTSYPKLNGGEYKALFSHPEATDAGGGVAIILSPTLKSRVIEDVTFAEGRVKYVRIRAAPDVDVAIVAVYMPAENAVQRAPVWPKLSNALERARRTCSRVICAGDFNVHLDGGNQPDEDELRVEMSLHGLEDCYRLCFPAIDPSDHTFTRMVDSRPSSSRVDYVLASQAMVQLLTDCSVVQSLSSLVTTDHRAVVARFSLTVLVDGPSTLPATLKFNDSAARTAEFQCILEEMIGPAELRSNVSAQAAFIAQCVETAAEKSFGHARTTPPPPKPAEHPPGNPSLRTVAALKKNLCGVLNGAQRGASLQQMESRLAKLRQQGLRLPRALPADREELLALVQQLSRIERTLRKENGRAWAQWRLERIAAATEARDSLFDTGKIKRWLQCLEYEERTPPTKTALDRNGQLLVDKQQVQAAAREHFISTIGTAPTIPTSSAPPQTRTADPAVEAAAAMVTATISEEEIKTAINKASVKKAPGPDGIQVAHLKHFGNTARAMLQQLFNNILSTSTWPECWKESILCPLPKPGLDGRNMKNTRPISLTQVLARLFASILSRRLLAFATPRLHPAQAAFLHGRSTLEHIMAIRMCVEHASERKDNPIFIGLLDVAKAYDTVPWCKLLSELHDFGLNNTFVQLMRSMHTGAKSVVRTGWGLAEPFDQKRGLLQGNPLSCLLFNIFMDPLLRKLASHVDPFIMRAKQAINNPPLPVSLFAYADDIAITSATADGVSEGIRICAEFFHAAGMSINQLKSVYTSSEENIGPLSIPASQSGAPAVNIPATPPKVAWRYLGVMMSASLDWTEQRVALKQVAVAALAAIGRRHLTGPQAAYYIRAVVFPRLTYRLITGCATNDGIKALQSRCVQAVRRAARMPVGICNEAITLPTEYHGLGVGSLRATTDGMMLALAARMMEEPHTMSGAIFAHRLRTWQMMLCLPYQPLAKIDTLPYASDSNSETSKHFHQAVRGAAYRQGVTAIVSTNLPDLMPSRMRQPHQQQPDNNLQPLRELFTAKKWKQHFNALSKMCLLYTSDAASVDGTQLAEYATLMRCSSQDKSTKVETSLCYQALQEAWSAADQQGSLRIGPGAVTIVISNNRDRELKPVVRLPALDVFAETVGTYDSSDPQDIYTDGSSSTTKTGETRCGAAVVSASGVDTDTSMLLRVRGEQNNYKAEVVGLAAVSAHAPRDPSVPIHVNLDALAVIKATESAIQFSMTPRQTAVTPCGELLAEISNDIRTRRSHGQVFELKWVKAHAGNPGNEAADRYAKRAAEHGAVTQLTTDEATHALATRIITATGRLEGHPKTYVRLRWLNEALRKRETHKAQGSSFKFLSEPEVDARDTPSSGPLEAATRQLARFPTTIKNAIKTNSFTWRSTTRTLAAHSYCAAPTAKWYVHRRVLDDKMCRMCGEAEQTAEHVVHDCLNDGVATSRKKRNDAVSTAIAKVPAAQRPIVVAAWSKIRHCPCIIAAVPAAITSRLKTYRPHARAAINVALESIRDAQEEWAKEITRLLLRSNRPDVT